MKRPVDFSQAKCDTCGKPYAEGDAIYSIADKWDEDNTEVDVLVSFRHWECHTPVDKALDDLKSAVKKAEDILGKFK